MVPGDFQAIGWLDPTTPGAIQVPKLVNPACPGSLQASSFHGAAAPGVLHAMSIVYSMGPPPPDSIYPTGTYTSCFLSVCLRLHHACGRRPMYDKAACCALTCQPHPIEENCPCASIQQRLPRRPHWPQRNSRSGNNCTLRVNIRNINITYYFYAKY